VQASNLGRKRILDSKAAMSRDAKDPRPLCEKNKRSRPRLIQFLCYLFTRMQFVSCEDISRHLVQFDV